MSDLNRLQYIAGSAVRALIDEAHTTPKPGLVDERNTGSHRDMTLSLLEASARSLNTYFFLCASIGASAAEPDDLFKQLLLEGIAAEKVMFFTTNGVNTHKGALFALGLLCAAAGMLPDASAENICLCAGRICSKYILKYLSMLTPQTAHTAGEKIYIEHHISGLRGEAAGGFATIRNLPLPTRAEGAMYLLRLLADIDDTTLIHRGGYRRACEIRRQVSNLLKSQPNEEDIIELDAQFIRENLTCGGCADLLACAYFLKDLEDIRS